MQQCSWWRHWDLSPIFCGVQAHGRSGRRRKGRCWRVQRLHSGAPPIRASRRGTRRSFPGRASLPSVWQPPAMRPRLAPLRPDSRQHPQVPCRHVAAPCSWESTAVQAGMCADGKTLAWQAGRAWRRLTTAGSRLRRSGCFLWTTANPGLPLVGACSCSGLALPCTHGPSCLLTTANGVLVQAQSAAAQALLQKLRRACKQSAESNPTPCTACRAGCRQVLQPSGVQPACATKG